MLGCGLKVYAQAVLAKKIYILCQLGIDLIKICPNMRNNTNYEIRINPAAG